MKAFVQNLLKPSNLQFALYLLFTVVCVAMPDLLFAQGSADATGQMAQKGGAAYNTIAVAVYFVLGVAVLACSVAVGFGAMEWRTLGRVIAAAVIASMVTAILSMSGLSSSGGSLT